MDSITNYKLQQFLRQDAALIKEYIDYLVWLTSTPTQFDIFYLTLREVQEIKDLMYTGTLDDIIRCVVIADGTAFDELKNMRILPFFAKVNSIKEQMGSIKAAEQTLSSKHHNFKWEAVGGADKMSKFGIYNILDNLSGGDFLKWDEVLDKVFADVFVKLSKDITMSDLVRDMDQIKTDTNV